MIVEKDLKKLFEELCCHDMGTISISGSPVTVRVFDQGSKLALATEVYNGGNYIPQSVRRCLLQKPPFRPAVIKTYLNVDENNYQISLNYLGPVDQISEPKFRDILEEFSWLAEEWRLFLDEHDKNDLVHVRVK